MKLNSYFHPQYQYFPLINDAFLNMLYVTNNINNLQDCVPLSCYDAENSLGWYANLVEWYWHRETKRLGGKPTPALVCLKVQHALPWEQTWAYGVKSQAYSTTARRSPPAPLHVTRNFTVMFTKVCSWFLS